MTRKEFRYVLPALAPCEFPEIPRPNGAELAVTVTQAGEVRITGNSSGLLYLARHLVAMGLHQGSSGLHVHLDPELGNLDSGSSSVIVSNRDFGIPDKGDS